MLFQNKSTFGALVAFFNQKKILLFTFNFLLSKCCKMELLLKMVRWNWPELQNVFLHSNFGWISCVLAVLSDMDELGFCGRRRWGQQESQRHKMLAILEILLWVLKCLIFFLKPHLWKEAINGSLRSHFRKKM